MNWFQRLFGRQTEERQSKAPATANATTSKTASPVTAEHEWKRVENFIPVDGEEARRVTLIASAIAAHDQAQSKFRVKAIRKVNPEAKQIALIIGAIAAGSQDLSRFQVKRIYKKKEGRD